MGVLHLDDGPSTWMAFPPSSACGNAPFFGAYLSFDLIKDVLPNHAPSMSSPPSTFDAPILFRPRRRVRARSLLRYGMDELMPVGRPHLTFLSKIARCYHPQSSGTLIHPILALSSIPHPFRAAVCRHSFVPSPTFGATIQMTCVPFRTGGSYHHKSLDVLISVGGHLSKNISLFIFV